MRIRLNNLKGSYVSKDKFQAYRKQNRIHKIIKWKLKTDLNAGTGAIEFIWTENGKMFKHRNLKKGICRYEERELWR